MKNVTSVQRFPFIKRIGRCSDTRDVEILIRLLEDKNWRIRAQTANALVNLTPASLPLLRKALKSDKEDKRIAAAQALIRLGREDWVKIDLKSKNPESAVH